MLTSFRNPTRSLLLFLCLTISLPGFASMPILKGIGGDFSLQSSRGGEVRLSDFKDKVVLMFFGYTNCADICPTTMAHISQLMQQLTPEHRRQVQVLFVSIDSDYDTPEHVNKYLNYFDSSFIGLVDSREKIDEVAALFHADYIKLAEEKVTTEYKKLSLEDKEAPSKKGYLYSHTAKIFILDGQGRVRGYFYTGTSLDEMREHISGLL